MRFMMMVKSAENPGAPPRELMEAINKLTVEQSQAGKLVAAGGLAPTAMSSRVRLCEGKLTVIDGPFVETKEVVGGYAVMEFSSKEAAVKSALEFMELHRKHWPGWEGETEIRQMFGPEEYELQDGKPQLKRVPNT
jgi:hypothetical protein